MAHTVYEVHVTAEPEHARIIVEESLEAARRDAERVGGTVVERLEFDDLDDAEVGTSEHVTFATAR